MKTSKIYSVVLIVIATFWVLSISIAFPIWFRPFYYAQVKIYGYGSEYGISADEAIYAYNDVLNYLNFGTPFKTGNLKWDEEEFLHFADCKVLFDLDTAVVAITSLLLVASIFLAKFKVLAPAKLGKFGYKFYAGIASVAIPLFILAFTLCVGFETVFNNYFHPLLFPGKDNWMFTLDQEIIKVLPMEFFLRCAIAIAVAIIAISACFITLEAVKAAKIKKMQEKKPLE